jgi:hypothetical protein
MSFMYAYAFNLLICKLEEKTKMSNENYIIILWKRQAYRYFIIRYF